MVIFFSSPSSAGRTYRPRPPPAHSTRKSFSPPGAPAPRPGSPRCRPCTAGRSRGATDGRCDPRSGARAPPLQYDLPLPGKPLLDLPEHQVGAGLRARQLPGMLLEERLDLPVELLFAPEIRHPLSGHLPQEQIVVGFRPDQPLLLPPGEDSPAHPADMLLPDLHPLLRPGGETHVRKSGPIAPARRYLSIETAHGQSLLLPDSARAAATASGGIAFFAFSTGPSRPYGEDLWARIRLRRC